MAAADFSVPEDTFFRGKFQFFLAEKDAPLIFRLHLIGDVQ